ncbi:MAG TPA: protein imuA [Caulobacteraceae bacterium]|jgi:protein ImuA|nr:protein imuA [Caulobacteraceae bacterium]
MSREARLLAVRRRIAALEAGAAAGVAPFGDARVDACLPGGGLPLGRWHEAAGEGMELETAAAAAAFIAALAAPLAERGAVVWVMRRQDLYAPGLAALGFPAERLIQVCARDEAQALGALEDALGAEGIAAAIGEVESPSLLAGRRLQLACERHGATGFVIRRRLFGGRASEAGSAAATRWIIAAAPSAPEAGEPGLGAPRWRVALERCRGGRPGAWIMEKSDDASSLRVVAELGDRQLDPAPSERLAG